MVAYVTGVFKGYADALGVDGALKEESSVLVSAGELIMNNLPIPFGSDMSIGGHEYGDFLERAAVISGMTILKRKGVTFDSSGIADLMYSNQQLNELIVENLGMLEYIHQTWLEEDKVLDFLIITLRNISLMEGEYTPVITDLLTLCAFEFYTESLYKDKIANRVTTEEGVYGMVPYTPENIQITG